MLETISRIVTIFFDVLYWAVLIRCLLSWIPMARNNPLGEIIIAFTEPVMGPMRRLFYNSPIGGGPVDFSPIFVLIFIQFAKKLVIISLVYIF